MNYNERITLVGGGGGVYNIAHNLKYIRPNITTTQTIFDYGKHSGQLRDAYGVLPPGDIRQAILALSSDTIQPILRQLLTYRFSSENQSALDGANMGNLILTALTKITGNFPAAIHAMCQMYQVQGKVLPISLDSAHLVVTFDDGSTLTGEGLIDTRPNSDCRTIVSAHLEPIAHIYTEAYDALVRADKIVLCQGDFWTSLMPNPLVRGFKEAIQQTKAKIILVVNIMTKKNETHGYTSATFVDKICDHIGVDQIDVAICNNGVIPPAILEGYAKEGAYPVQIVASNRAKEMITSDFADWSGNIIRHNQKTVSALEQI